MPERDWSDALLPFRQTWGALQGAASRDANRREQGFWAQIEQLSTLPSAATQQAFASVRDWQVELAEQAAAGLEQAQRQAGGFAQSMLRQARAEEPLSAAGQGVRRLEQAAVSGAKSTLRGTEQVASQAIGSAGRAMEGLVDAADAGFQQVGRIGQRALDSAGKAVAESGLGQPVAQAVRGAWGVLDDIGALVSELWPLAAPEPTQAGAADAGSAPSRAMGARGEQQLSSPAPRGDGAARDNQGVLGVVGELVAELWREPSAKAAPSADAGGASRQEPRVQSAATPVREPRPAAPDALAPVLQPAFSGRQLGALQGGAARSSGPAESTGAAGGASAASGGLSPSQASAGSDDELMERLNRALIEQAWLRGVDLT